MKLTNQQLNKIKNIPFRYDLHWKMWDWLSKRPAADELDYLYFHPDERALVGDCFYHECKYSNLVSYALNGEPDFKCAYCPLKPKSKRFCLGGLWNDWVKYKANDDYVNAAKCAAMIRDLPLNPMFNFKDVK